MEDLDCEPSRTGEALRSSERHVSGQPRGVKNNEQPKTASSALLPSVQELLRDTNLSGSQIASKEQSIGEAGPERPAWPFIEEL